MSFIKYLRWLLLKCSNMTAFKALRSHLDVRLLRVHQLLDDLAQPLRGTHVLVTRPVWGGLSSGNPSLPGWRFLGVVHQAPGARACTFLEGLVEGAHCVHALQRVTERNGSIEAGQLGD